MVDASTPGGGLRPTFPLGILGAALRWCLIGRLPPSSSGPGYLVLSQETGVRFPLGVLPGQGFLVG